MATQQTDGHNGHTFEDESWDLFSSSSDTLALISSDENGEAAEVYPWGIDISITQNPGAIGSSFAERSDLLRAEQATYERELDILSNPVDFPHISSEDLIRFGEARASMKNGIAAEELQNIREMHKFYAIRDEIIHGAAAELTPMQVFEKVRDLKDIVRDLEAGNEEIRERLRTYNADSDDTDGNNGDDEAASPDDHSSDSDGSDFENQQNTGDDTDEIQSNFVDSESNSVADGETTRLLPPIEPMASSTADRADNGENPTSITADDDEKYKVNVDTVFSPEDCSDSRRVLLKGIPQHTTLTQIANAVTGVGGLVRINLQETVFHTATAFITACVEFRESTSAKKYVSNVKANGLEFVGASGRFFEVEVEMIKTKSSYESRHGHPHTYGVGHYSEHSGRCITLNNFPMSAVWYLLSQLGMKYVIRVAFEVSDNKMTGKLSVELASTHEAGRLCGLVLYGNFRPYKGVIAQMGFGETPSDRDIDELTSSVSNTINYVSPKHLEMEWNVQPFNIFTPSQNFTYGTIPRRAVTSLTSSLAVEISSVISHVREVANAVPHVQVRDEKTDTTLREVPFADITFSHVDDGMKYIITGGAIFARQATGEVYTKVDGRELAELKEAKVLKQKWADFWAHYCKVNGLEDIRKYAEYGRIAQIRRGINKKLGRASSYNPEQLLATPTEVPNVVKDYLDSNGRKVVPTEK
ncbi:hypothetical protein IL306_002395 [Fusarium sp. DS 682]|nr:hypothetical protein IL306_002395 [Fusarium sp. DS 682]